MGRVQLPRIWRPVKPFHCPGCAVAIQPPTLTPYPIAQAGVDPNTIAKSVKNLSLSDRDATPAANDAAGVVRVVAGTFGNRQGLRTTSECGPFTHMFEF